MLRFVCTIETRTKHGAENGREYLHSIRIPAIDQSDAEELAKAINDADYGVDRRAFVQVGIPSKRGIAYLEPSDVQHLLATWHQEKLLKETPAFKKKLQPYHIPDTNGGAFND